MSTPILAGRATASESPNAIHQVASGPTADPMVVPPAIEARALTRAYGPTTALRRVNLRVEFGESVAILGANGAGKTTLLRTLAALDRPSAGSLSIAGCSIPREAADVRPHIGAVMHQTLLYDDLTARENLEFFARLYELADPRGRTDELLRWAGLDARQHERVRTFSRGMQQRLSLARAIAHDPPILLLDEPDTGLDAGAVDLLTDLLISQSSGGPRRRTVVIATHAVDRALALCRRVVVLHRGQIVLDVPTERTSTEEVGRLLAQLASGEPPTSVVRREPSDGRGAASQAAAVATSASTTGRTAQDAHSAAPTPHPLRTAGLILWKDLAIELRTRQIVSAMLVFALLVLVTFNFAFDLRVDNVTAVAPGVLWVAIVFAGTLGLGRTFVAEWDRGSLVALLLAPIRRESIYLAKLGGNLLFMLAVEVGALAVYSAFFNVSGFAPEMLLVAALGTIGFSSVGTLFAALTTNTRARELLLPILLFPILVPVILGAVKATAGLIDQSTTNDPWLWIQLLAAFDVIFVTLSAIVFPAVVEE